MRFSVNVYPTHVSSPSPWRTPPLFDTPPLMPGRVTSLPPLQTSSTPPPLKRLPKSTSLLFLPLTFCGFPTVGERKAGVLIKCDKTPVDKQEKVEQEGARRGLFAQAGLAIPS